MLYPDRSLETAQSLDTQAIREAEQGIRYAVEKLEIALKSAVDHPDWVDRTATISWIGHMYGRKVQ